MRDHGRHGGTSHGNGEPADRTQGYICGLQFAALKVTELDELGNLTDDSQTTEYFADDLGRFTFAFLPGRRGELEPYIQITNCAMVGQTSTRTSV